MTESQQKTPDPTDADHVDAEQTTASANPLRRRRLRGLIRWKYVLPRLGLVLVVVLTARFCLDGVLRWALIQGGQAALGAKVDVGTLTTSIPRGEVVLRNLAATNPSKPMKNAAAADEARLQIDVGALFHKRLVIRDGTISGLQFDTTREESGALPAAAEPEATDPSVIDPVLTTAASRSSAWLDELTERLQGDLTKDLQTPRVAQELQERWPQEYAELKKQVDDLQQQGKQIEASFKQVKSNPLRNFAGLEKLQSDLTTADQQLQSLTAKINALPNQLKADQMAVESARVHDEQYIRQSLELREIDGQQLNEYLLGQETHGYLSTALTWARQLRVLLPAKKMEVEESRQRGVNVLFVDRMPPKWLVQQVALSGRAQIGGQPLNLTGMLTDATSDPQLHGIPMRLTLKGQGAFPCELQAEIDRTRDQPRDVFTLRCPRLPTPARSMGRPEKISVALAAGEAQLNAKVVLDGDALAGSIMLAQERIQLTAKIGSLREPQLAQALAGALESLDQIDAKVTVSGTLERPEWRLESSLGPRLATSLKTALGDYLRQRGQQALAETRAKVDKQLAALNAQRQAAQQEFLGKLGKNQQFLAEMAGGAESVALKLPQFGNLPLEKIRR